MSLSFGNNLIHLAEVDSTNEFALKLLQETNVFNGTVILADNQTRGRGQRGAGWFTEPGSNLTFSIILRSIKLNPTEQFLLSKMIALAIINTLSGFISKAEALKIKWPNDIYYESKKLGGVLVENKFRGNIWDASVVGIGLNINQTDFDESIKDKAISLATIEGKLFDMKEILDYLIIEIEKGYLLLNSSNSPKLIEQAYLSQLFGVSEYHTYKLLEVNEHRELLIVDVLSSGQVIMRDKDENQFEFWFKEVELV